MENYAKNLERDLEIFCEEFGIEVKTFLNWISYPGLLDRLHQGCRIKPVTVQRVYNEMTLRRFKLEIKECVSVREAHVIAQKFLKQQAIELI